MLKKIRAYFLFFLYNLRLCINPGTLMKIFYAFFLLVFTFQGIACSGQVIPGQPPHVVTSAEISANIDTFVSKNEPEKLLNYIDSLAPISYDSNSFINYSNALQYLLDKHLNFIQNNPMLLKPLARDLYTVGVNNVFYAGVTTYNPHNILLLKNIADSLPGADPDTTNIKWTVNHFAELLKTLFAFYPTPLDTSATAPTLLNHSNTPTVPNPVNPVSRQPATWGFIPPNHCSK